MPSRRSTTEPDPPSMPTNPQPFDFGESQKGQARGQAHDHTGGAGKPRTNLQIATGVRDVSPIAPPLKLAEIDAECQKQPSQELIDRLDMVRC